jgi:Sigma-70, region 4
MSAALQLPVVWEECSPQRAGYEERRTWKQRPAVAPAAKPAVTAPDAGLVVSLGFYRKHTESLLRRYLYASMQVGRAPNILGDPIARGWCSSRPIRTFEDAVIFVLDVERCLNQLGSLDRIMLNRIVLQEYTQAETATLLGMGVRTISYKFPAALDRLTEKLLETGLLVLPC